MISPVENIDFEEFLKVYSKSENLKKENYTQFLNPDKKLIKKIRARLKITDGYCPCKPDRIEDNICPCKEFRESKKCCCNLYDTLITTAFNPNAPF